jgi:hypothetical protein
MPARLLINLEVLVLYHDGVDAAPRHSRRPMLRRAVSSTPDAVPASYILPAQLEDGQAESERSVAAEHGEAGPWR